MIERVEDLPLWPEIESGRYADEWIKVGLTEGPRCTDEDVKKLFKILDLPCEVILWAKDPITGGRACRLRLAGVDLREWVGKDIERPWVEKQMEKLKKAGKTIPPIDRHVEYGQHGASWVAYRLAFRGVPGLDLHEVEALEPIVRGSCWYFHAHETVILTDRVAPKLDAHGELHSLDGPAIWDLYAIHGVVLPRDLEWVVKNGPPTREQIDKIGNAEVRRVVIRAWPEQYAVGEPAQEDDYGQLFRATPEMNLVKVKDASTDRTYFLRVPATCQTAHEGVAWTFDKRPDQYAPQVQT
jgi:hypothetical protein